MAPRHALVLAAALAATWSLGSAASAQTVAPAAPAPSAPPATYDDVVILKSGARYRGVIGELVPNDHVEILLATGQTRSLAMSDVLYAGPLAKAPEAAAAPGQVARPTVTFPAPSHEGGVSFEAVALSGPLGPHVALGEVTADVVGARGIGLAYNKLCDAPCQPSLAAGPHRLVVILGRGVVSGLTSLDIPAEPSTLRATSTGTPGSAPPASRRCSEASSAGPPSRWASSLPTRTKALRSGSC